MTSLRAVALSKICWHFICSRHYVPSVSLLAALDECILFVLSCLTLIELKVQRFRPWGELSQIHLVFILWRVSEGYGSDVWTESGYNVSESFFLMVQVAIPVVSVRLVKKHKTAGLVPNGLAITTDTSQKVKKHTRTHLHSLNASHALTSCKPSWCQSTKFRSLDVLGHKLHPHLFARKLDL